MVRRIDRRRLLAIAGSVATLSLAGCTQDDGSDGTDGDANDETTSDDESTTAATTADMGASQPTATGDVAFDLNVSVSDRSYTDLSKFETLVIRVSGFELHATDGTSVRREHEPVELDLTEIAGEGETDLVETHVPAGEYDEIAVLASVVDYTTVDGSDDSLPFENSDPITTDLGFDGAYEITAGRSITFDILLSVQQTFAEDAWKFNAGYSAMG